VGHNPGVGGWEGSKRFFFEKKKQKTFTSFGAEYPPRKCLNGQKFFASFFQKRSACFLLNATLS
jgi:hypothetical protein